MDDQEDEAAQSLNQVRLRGRVASDPTARTLPSGAEIVTVRVVVGREATVMTRGSRQKSDWVECSTWTAALRRKVASWRADDVVEVEGALRRRHYRAGESGSSVVEIEVMAVRRLQRQPATV